MPATKQELIDELAVGIVKLLDDDWVMDAIDDLIPDELDVEEPDAETLQKYDDYSSGLTREVTLKAISGALDRLAGEIPNP